jgi:CDP-6-deoxy-D-xylo-4-hexulose-3-dehydrase
LNEGLSHYEQYFHLPTATRKSVPSWFGYAITVRDDAPFSRLELIQFLESRKIGTRLLFGGNIVRQPAYESVKSRSIGELRNANLITRGTFWIGVHPGLTDSMIDFTTETISNFIRRS